MIFYSIDRLELAVNVRLMNPSLWHLNFDNRFAALPEPFYTKMPAEGFSKKPWLIHANPRAAALIGLTAEALRHQGFAEYFSGNRQLPGSDPLAMAYSGHQFGQWAGQLGDGRALLLGQVRNQQDDLWDIQLKGSGKTPYSRFGDGRAVLRSCIREYLCSEAMFGLGIPTTRALSVVGTGEPVFREKPEPGAVFTRLAPSHIRFGHFEHFASRRKTDEVKLLADHVIQEYFPHISVSDQRYAIWFQEIVRRTAILIAQWQAVGFAHGVMNTDNMSVLGLTLDYGPFGFMEAFDPGLICNHSDDSGRFAYDQQPAIGLWNLHAFAHALKSLLPWEEAMEIMRGYDSILTEAYQALMRNKIGVGNQDDDLWIALVTLMAEQQSDYTLTFRYLSDSFTSPETWRGLFTDKAPAASWLNTYHAHMKAEDPKALKARLNAINPKFVLRNWVAETVIRMAEDEGRYSMLDTLLSILHHPYDEHEDFAYLAAPAPERYSKLGVSCSS